jgi:hypothetical protein
VEYPSREGQDHFPSDPIDKLDRRALRSATRIAVASRSSSEGFIVPWIEPYLDHRENFEIRPVDDAAGRMRVRASLLRRSA